MKIWLFTFTDGKSPIVSIQVAAKDKYEACATLTDSSDITISTEELYPHNGSTILCAYYGECLVESPQVLAYMRRGAVQ